MDVFPKIYKEPLEALLLDVVFNIKNRRCVAITKKVRRSLAKIYLFVYELSATMQSVAFNGYIYNDL